MRAISESKQRGLGIILQYAQMVLNIVIQFLYTPIMLRILGKNEYGIYNLASSIIAYLSLLSLGFGASYLRYYSRYKKNKDEDGLARLNGLYLLVFTFIGVISLVIGLFFTHNIRVFYNETYSANEIAIAKILMFFLTINMAISFPASVFNSYITSQEKFIFQKVVNMGKTIMSPVVNIILLYLGYGSVGMVISTTCLSLIVDYTNIVYCFKKLNMKILFGKPNMFLLKEIFAFSVFIALNQLIDQINWQTDKIILGKVVNGAAVAVYSVGANINTMFTNFSSAISGVYAPKINLIVSKNEKDMDKQLSEIFCKVGRLQWYVLSLILSGFIFFGKFFIKKWAGDGYENSYWVALLLMAPAIVPLIQNIGLEIQRAKNKHQVRSVAYLIMAVVNVYISVWFASMWGEIGTALGTTISIIIVPIVFMNIFYQLKLGIDVKSFWRSIAQTIPALSVPILFGICINIFYSYKSLLDFGIFVFLYAVIFLTSTYFLAFSYDEKQIINRIVSKIFHGKTER